ncbi:hypothetical protein BZG36_01279 [Bifiguratus adelaidae]|uniref:Uncharacterized protein n=1 Tax=Bifiguratus adelaidae TaxID=1938954 RepID=A0A261Y5B8_9FUNG|nr:hypothetical protein BZG36_01279 [Bifiguratus adelaidae]
MAAASEIVVNSMEHEHIARVPNSPRKMLSQPSSNPASPLSSPFSTPVATPTTPRFRQSYLTGIVLASPEAERTPWQDTEQLLDKIMSHKTKFDSYPDSDTDGEDEVISRSRSASIELSSTPPVTTHSPILSLSKKKTTVPEEDSLRPRDETNTMQPEDRASNTGLDGIDSRISDVPSPTRRHSRRVSKKPSSWWAAKEDLLFATRSAATPKQHTGTRKTTQKVDHKQHRKQRQKVDCEHIEHKIADTSKERAEMKVKTPHSDKRSLSADNDIMKDEAKSSIGYEKRENQVLILGIALPTADDLLLDDENPFVDLLTRFNKRLSATSPPAPNAKRQRHDVEDNDLANPRKPLGQVRHINLLDNSQALGASKPMARSNILKYQAPKTTWEKRCQTSYDDDPLSSIKIAALGSNTFYQKLIREEEKPAEPLIANPFKLRTLKTHTSRSPIGKSRTLTGTLPRDDDEFYFSDE